VKNAKKKLQRAKSNQAIGIAALMDQITIWAVFLITNNISERSVCAKRINRLRKFKL
jgi:hypothetical protein